MYLKKYGIFLSVHTVLVELVKKVLSSGIDLPEQTGYTKVILGNQCRHRSYYFDQGLHCVYCLVPLCVLEKIQVKNYLIYRKDEVYEVLILIILCGSLGSMFLLPTKHLLS